ncbi:PREDICTED: protein OSB2, chloroplastic-like isoform X2 [Ipomoea nil]|uniref:protein OSB2, chloroplastic-like isoform X2 n=1 Tax=Ipomoea nil TaxID=35883 RepID=UPI00090103EE|nr:PREDICTED: protein OSB2, chloroplastic-like isoform X2 [Ipomoea nil]
MALEQAVFVLKHSLILNAPLAAGSHIPPSLSLNFQTLSLRLPSRSRVHIRLVCFCRGGGPISDSSNCKGAVVEEKPYPRPAEIQWKKELCNSVQLIGVVAKPVQIRHFASGKVIAWSRLSVKKSQQESGRIDLKFWGELAHIAFQHLKEGDQIYVSGRLVLDALEGEDGKQQTYYKVTVQQMNFVGRNSSSSAGMHDGRKQRNDVANNSPGSIEESYEKRLNAMEAENGRMAAKHDELEAKVAMFEQMVREMNMNKMTQKPEGDDDDELVS